MASQNKRIPAKLENDAIVEAIFEIRFDMETLPEVIFGRLTDYDPWKGFRQSRLPAYNLPAPLRQADPNLRYQPVFELQDSMHNRKVRIGAQVLSYHRLSPYNGWEYFKPELDEVIDGLFSKAEGLTIRRLGLRYINAIIPELHNSLSLANLDLKLSIANEDISDNVNINFTSQLSNDTQCTVRVSTTEFVQGAIPQNTSVFYRCRRFYKRGFQN